MARNFDYLNVNFSKGSPLNSGIRVMPGKDYVNEGIANYYKSLNSLNAGRIKIEQEAIKKFESLIDVSMKGVSGKFQTEAQAKKDAYLQNVVTAFKDSNGRPNAQQMMALKKQKSELEEFAFMYQDLRKVYGESVKAAIGIKDDVSREKSLNNIADIMENSKSLQEAWDKMTSMRWYVPGNTVIDPYKLRTDILKVGGKYPTAIETEIDEFGNPVFKTTKEGDKEIIDKEIQRTWDQFGTQLRNKGFQTIEDWRYFVGTGKEINIQRYKNTESSGGDFNFFGNISSSVTPAEMTGSTPLIANKFETIYENGAEVSKPVEGSQVEIPTAGAIGMSNKTVTLKSTGNSYNLNNGADKFYNGYTAPVNVFQIAYVPVKGGNVVTNLKDLVEKKDKKALAGIEFKPYIVGISKLDKADVTGIWELNDENIQQLKMAYGKKLDKLDAIPKSRPFVFDESTSAKPAGKTSGYDYSQMQF